MQAPRVKASKHQSLMVRYTIMLSYGPFSFLLNADVCTLLHARPSLPVLSPGGGDDDDGASSPWHTDGGGGGGGGDDAPIYTSLLTMVHRHLGILMVVVVVVVVMTHRYTRPYFSFWKG